MTFKKQKLGFTLIEVMIAMFIVATAISALMLKMMSIVDDTVYLEQKTVAHWVAMNQLELLRIKNQHTNQLLTEEISGEEDMAGRQWYWRAKPVKTGDDGFIQIEMSVSDGAEDEPIMTVMSLTDRYHKAL